MQRRTYPTPRRKAQLHIVGNNQDQDVQQPDEMAPVSGAKSAMEAVNCAQDAEQGFGNLLFWLHGPAAMTMDADAVEKSKRGLERARTTQQRSFLPAPRSRCNVGAGDPRIGVTDRSGVAHGMSVQLIRLDRANVDRFS